MKEIDPFGSQKQLAFTSSLAAMAALASYLLKTCDTIKADTLKDVKEEFIQFFQVNNPMSAHKISFSPVIIFM